MARPLTHPAINDLSVFAILHALADPARLAIVRELLKAPDGLSCTETTQRLDLALAKSTCSQHYRILRESGVITSERKGVELSSRVRVRELEERFPGLLSGIIKAFERELLRDARARRASP